jgi:hypothetical protein
MESIRASKTKLMFAEGPPGDFQQSPPINESAARPERASPYPAPGPLTSAFSIEMQPTPPGAVRCTTCLQLIAFHAQMCPHCRCFTSPDGEYHGPVTFAPGATSSVLYGVLGLFILGFVFGPIAWLHASRAKRAIANDPRFSGRGRATVGMILGAVATFAHVTLIAITLSGMVIGGAGG